MPQCFRPSSRWSSPRWSILPADSRRLGATLAPPSALVVLLAAIMTVSTFSSAAMVGPRPGDSAGPVGTASLAPGPATTGSAPSPPAPASRGAAPADPSIERGPGPAATIGTNSSPVAEFGTALGTVTVGDDPRGVAVNGSNGWAYVAEFGSGAVTIINDTGPIASVPLGSTSSPFGAAWDPLNGLVYVSDWGSNEVSVIRGEKLIDTITVGLGPEGIAVDPGTGYAYVADSGSALVTVLNGTSLLASVPVGASSGPSGVAYDSANGDVYVTDNGNDNVTVINDTSEVDVFSVPNAPSGIAYDPVADRILVSESTAASIDVVDNTTPVANLSVGAGPMGIAFDPANGYAYITNEGGNTVSVFNGTKILGSTIGTGAAPVNAAFDPLNGLVYVSDSDQAALTRISTEFGEGPPTIYDHGISTEATDVGQMLNVTAIVWGVGSLGLQASVHVAPAPGLGCAGSVNVTPLSDEDFLYVDCAPIAEGTYTIWLNTTDNDHAKQWGEVSIPVDPALVVPPPTIDARYYQSTASADVNQTVRFVANASGGSGVYDGYVWMGIVEANCTGLETMDPSCAFRQPGTYEIHVEVNDTNSATTYSLPTPLDIFPRPSVGPPTANRSSADVDEPVKFVASPSGGPGAFTFAWSGLENATCTGTTGATPECNFTKAGFANVSVTAIDAVGGMAMSSALRFHVYPQPIIADPTADHSQVDVGQPISFFTNASGGFGNYSYEWQGLPTPCEEANTSHPSCTPDAAGTIVIGAVVLDGNGGSATAATSLTVSVNPDPTVSAPALSNDDVTSGSALTITASPSDGSGGYAFVWSGLPPGCAGTTAVIHCAPTGRGSYPIRVSVRDSDNYSVTSPAANLTVTLSSSSALAASLPIYAGIAVVAVLAVVGGILLVRRRRRPTPATNEAPAVVVEPPGGPDELGAPEVPTIEDASSEPPADET